MLAPLPGKVATVKTISKTDQASEIRRCSKDPAYFAKNYIYIKHKDKGSVKFKLWDFQEETLKAFQNNRMNIILKSRQLGITELMGMYVLWFTLFQKDKNVVIVSKNRRQASQIIKRIKYAYKKLPSWLKIVKMVSDNVHTIEFDNDSIIFADATTENAGRGEACSLFIVDEAAFIPELEEMWASVFPTINNGGSCIVGSTPNGGAGQFYNLYINAPENGFNKIKLDWDCHPERNQEWYEETKRSMSPKKFAQEFLCVNGEAKVFTKNGYKEIKNINVGEEVLTHKGRFKKVIKTYKSIVNKQELVTIKSPLSKNYEFQITKNHPFLVAEKSDKLPLTNNIRKYIKTNNFIQNWKCLYELDLNPVVRNFENAIFPVFNLSQTYKEKIIDLAKLCIHSDISEGLIRYVNQWGCTKRYIDIDYDLGKFIGLFLAEGSYQDNYKKVSLAFDSSEENLIEFIKNFYIKYNIKFHIEERIKKKNKSHCTIITTTNKFIKNILQLYIDGNYCYEKVLKDVCFELDKSVIKGIIDGLWLGDGYHIPTTKNVLSITSEKLIYQIRILMSAFGCITRIDQKDLNIKNNKLLPQFLLELNGVKYRTIEKCTENSPEYINGSRSILANDFWWAKSWIEEYNESETLDVYNIEVEEDNSYCLVGLVVHNCSFLLSGDTVVEGEDILRHEKSICDPKEEMGPERAVWKWKNYNPEHRYLISADTARGDGEDFSAFTVINADTLEIVCEYKGKIKVNKFAELLAYIGYEYGTCLIVVENNTYGLAVLVKLIEMKYPVIYGEEKGGKVYSEGHVDWDLDDVVPGFRTDIASRVLSVDKLEESFRLDKVITYSKRLIDELRNFIYENGKPQARKNANDDIVISLAIGLYVCSYVFGSKDSDTQLTKKLLETIRRIDQSINYKTINEPGFSSEGNIYKQNPSDPYSAIYRDQVVDFRWVINNHKSEKKVENKGISFLGVLR